MLATSTCESTKFAVLVDRLADPVDTRVVADGVVSGVHKDDLKVLVDRILIHPVGIENTKTATFSSHALLRQATKVTSRFQLCDTLVHGLSIHNTLQFSHEKGTKQ